MPSHEEISVPLAPNPPTGDEDNDDEEEDEEEKGPKSLLSEQCKYCTLIT